MTEARRGAFFTYTGNATTNRLALLSIPQTAKLLTSMLQLKFYQTFWRAAKVFHESFSPRVFKHVSQKKQLGVSLNAALFGVAGTTTICIIGTIVCERVVCVNLRDVYILPSCKYTSRIFSNISFRYWSPKAFLKIFLQMFLKSFQNVLIYYFSKRFTEFLKKKSVYKFNLRIFIHGNTFRNI